MSYEEISLQYASIGRRLLAHLLDAVVLFIPCIIGGHVIPVVGGLIVFLLYAPVLECSEIKATLGKRWMGIQVADPMGRRISFRAAMARNVLKIVSAALLFIGFFFGLFTQKKQMLHDLLADTVVVYGRSELPVVAAWKASLQELLRK